MRVLFLLQVATPVTLLRLFTLQARLVHQLQELHIAALWPKPADKVTLALGKSLFLNHIQRLQLYHEVAQLLDGCILLKTFSLLLQQILFKQSVLLD